MVESGKGSRIITEKFGVEWTHIQETMKRKREFLDDYENNFNPVTEEWQVRMTDRHRYLWWIMSQ